MTSCYKAPDQLGRRQQPGGNVSSPEPRHTTARTTGGHPRALNEGRRRNMQANKRSDTKPEKVLRSALHRSGYRFRKDLRLTLLGNVRVRPDVVFTRRKVAVFVDGCFWHVCPEHGRQPTTNAWYWSPKLAGNVARDRRADAALTEAGWTVVRIWEHESLEGALAKVACAVRIEHVFDPSVPADATPA